MALVLLNRSNLTERRKKNKKIAARSISASLFRDLKNPKERKIWEKEPNGVLR